MKAIIIKLSGFKMRKKLNRSLHKGGGSKNFILAAQRHGHEGEKHPMGLQAVMIDVFSASCFQPRRKKRELNQGQAIGYGRITQFSD